MGLFARAGTALARAYSRRAPTDGRTPPVVDVSGAAQLIGAGTPVNTNPQIDRAANSLTALLGLLSPSAGPIASRWSSYPATDLTPAKIV